MHYEHVVQRHTWCSAWRAALPWNLWEAAESNGEAGNHLGSQDFCGQEGKEKCFGSCAGEDLQAHEVTVCAQGCELCTARGAVSVLSSCVGCWVQDLSAAEPQSFFSGWMWSCDLVFLSTESSGTASSPFSLSFALPRQRPPYLPRSTACQCREINTAWAGCCGFWFACLYIQKLSICSEQINMSLMIGKEKKQTLVIKC